ncbi:MAG TPA: ABC transporter ATP-binding protein [Acidimicrobiales bacterium]|nr:ABC transporter ATP-binding protein [Acidimicrobiales bacterium]
MDVVVRSNSLVKDYGRHRALDGIDLAIERGEVFGYLGPNGAGKTTTLRLLVGLLRPTSGTATAFGLDCWSDSLAVRARTGYLPGDVDLYPKMTGEDVLGYFMALRGLTDWRSPRALAERLDLDLRRPTRALSRGNKQKLGIVQALMGEPELLLLDEPTSGLDPLVQTEFHRLVRDAASRGCTVVLSSHVLSEVQQLADRVGIVRAGHLVAVESLEALREKSIHRVEARFSGIADRSRFAALPGLRDLVVEPGVLRCRLPAAGLDSLVKVLATLHLDDVSIVEGDLEELFLTFYEGSDDGARAGQIPA